MNVEKSTLANPLLSSETSRVGQDDALKQRTIKNPRRPKKNERLSLPSSSFLTTPSHSSSFLIFISHSPSSLHWVSRMFAPRPGLIRSSLAALNNVAYLTNLPEEGKGTWNHAKDSQEYYDYIILGGKSPCSR
jgi:hypothetical protein